jgi:hypothetical protein
MTRSTSNLPAPDATSPKYLVDDAGARILQAASYFDALDFAQADPSGFNPNLADSEGLVSYIVGTTNPPDDVKALYDEVKPVMEGLADVVVSAVLSKAKGDPKIQHDPATWRGPMQAVIKVFCAGYVETQQHYDQQIYGVEIAPKVINILLDAIVDPGEGLDEFKTFLQSQGETMRALIEGGQDSYLFACIAIVHEIFQAADGKWIYAPKLKSFFTQFDRDTFGITSACASLDPSLFKFGVQSMTGAFMVERWKGDEAFRDQVRAFIEKYRKVQIADSDNYCDASFTSQPA